MDTIVTAARLASVPVLTGRVRPATDLLHEARTLERSGCAPEALERYGEAISAAQRHGDSSTHAEALRRLAVLKHQRGEATEARALCRESACVAREAGKLHLAAESLNTLGCIDLSTGSLADARMNFISALALGSASQELEARVEQNLGVIANIQGDLEEAIRLYTHSLEAHRAGSNEHGCAIAYHNLGLVSADQELWSEASEYFAQSLAIAERAGDVYLRAQCLVGDAKAKFARQRYDDARTSAERSLALFEQLGARADKSGAYRIIGVVYRETGRAALAESRLRGARQLAVDTDSVLNEAEAARERAPLYQTIGRNQEALTFLDRSHQLFDRLDARRDLINVGGMVVDLEGTYLAVVREWGMSIETADGYTFGHCSRVAEVSVAVAQAIGLSELEITTIRSAPTSTIAAR